MRVLVTGANGFIGKNLGVWLREKGIEVVPFLRGMPFADMANLVGRVDFVFHLAGINRPDDDQEFVEGNTRLTEQLCAAIQQSGRQIPVLYTSSIQAEAANAYGVSKRNAESALLRLSRDSGCPIYIYRLPNVFGKWSRPNYNSVVATFCYNIANSLPIQVNNDSSLIKLVYIDDVVADFLEVLRVRPAGGFREIATTYVITVGALADQIQQFKAGRVTLHAESVGLGWQRALYATYLSFLSPEDFSYEVPVHADNRGRFVEILKTSDSGQFSYFTAYPGVTRGGHYHHTKNEKFLVIQGKARFGFRNVITGDTFEMYTDGCCPEVVETVPGWAHDITNVGKDEMIVALWANEVFDSQRPDTIKHKV